MTNTNQSPAETKAATFAESFIDAVIRDVAELPDRTSPSDNPNAMIVTADELRQILLDRLEYAGLQALAIEVMDIPTQGRA